MAFLPPSPLLPHIPSLSKPLPHTRPTAILRNPRRARPLSAPSPSPSFPLLPAATRLASSAGLSTDTSTSVAVASAVASARAGLGGATARLAVVGATAARDAADVSAALADALPGVPFVGATSCGGVLTPRGAAANGVSVLLLGGAPGDFATAGARFADGRAEEEGAAAAAAQALVAEIGEVAAVYVMGVPGSEEAVLKGVQSVVGEGTVVFGGSAADDDVSGRWAVFESDTGATGAGVVMFGVRKGGVKVGASLVSPYEATETVVKVTECEGRTLKTLDGRPAADVLYELVGDAIESEHKHGGMTLAPMSTRPFALRRGGDLLAVHVAAINQPAATVSLFAEAQAGDELVAMHNAGGGDSASAAGSAIRAAYAAAKTAAGIAGDPSAALLVYCGGLAIAVADRLEENMTEDFAGLDGLPEAAVGFTAFGEQGPCWNEGGARNQHRNLSVGMLVLQ